MLLLFVLILWEIQAVPQHQFNMYNMKSNHDGYCLSYYVLENFGIEFEAYGRVHQLISYCLRTPQENNFIANFSFENTIDPSFTFADLKEQNMTSQMLLSLSASIDLAERYEIFLNNHSASLSGTEELFHNCTSLWFGPFCRFMFDYKVDGSFDGIVRLFFHSKFRVNQGTKITCYEHLHCETRLSCLDWREICDGKNDCLDGSDESNCWQLEVNKCTKEEYRCLNGQCIPIEFFRDISHNSDCLDQTDERLYINMLECHRDPTFRCEEHTCLISNQQFPCGDGECTNGIYKCYNGRYSLLSGDFCSNVTICLLQISNPVYDKWCKQFCPKFNCVKNNCSALYEFRSISPLLGHVTFIFSNKKIEPNKLSLPEYVCYDQKLCTDLLLSTEYLYNKTCSHFNDLGLKNVDQIYNVENLLEYVKDRFRVCLIATNERHYCNYSMMYQCENSSKCISKQRLLDGIQDCPSNDDETFNESCSLNDIHQRFKCSSDDDEKCFASLVFQNGKENCKDGEDEGDQQIKFRKKRIQFQTICDGKIDLLPLLINGTNQTDETECEHWLCNNTYSRCDTFWLCKNGADEINCPPSTCPEQEHSCVFPNDTSKVSCLPIDRADNGIDDCLGGTDERKKNLVYSDFGSTESHFHCWNDTTYVNTVDLCNGKADCRYHDDETFCKQFGSVNNPFCTYFLVFFRNVDKFLCDFARPFERKLMVYFKLHNILTYPLQLIDVNTSSTSMTQLQTSQITRNPTVRLTSDEAWSCTRGIPIRIRMDTKRSESYCLCPPSYYGDRCQYQNQRVSITLQIRVISDWRIVFIFLITLIDHEKNIGSHDYIEYSPIRDCTAKFNVYLLYSTRPKNSSKNYSVQIDAFNHLTLVYRASWIFPLQFPFLPVHPLSVILRTPFSNMKPTQKCWSPCVHGQCFHYVNKPNSTFCRCQSDWSGAQCNEKYTCNCALGSLCVSDSICLCSRGRFGPRCHLFHPTCHSTSCMNGGQCLPLDVRHTSATLKKSMCICPQGFVGDRCQHQLKQTRIDITFHRKLTIPSSLLVHFIAVQNATDHNRTSVMKKIRFDQYSLTFFISVSFNIAIAQMFNQYYLIILREKAIIVGRINTQIAPSHQCRSISELFNETFAKQHLLRRIKYYHIPCQEQSNLVCFHDKVHFCLCNLDREANCFEFDHNMTYDCGGYNYCENKGHCFQDDLKCPTASFCSCDQCYFGSRCQFSTKGSTLSLDTILGYHIRSKTGIGYQSTIVKVTIVLTTTMFVLGFLNSFLSFQTFRGKQTRNVGCGLYLLVSSIISIIIIVLLKIKFWFLLLSQIDSINNRSFSYIQCIFLDFLLQSLLSTSDWLSACVAIERAMNIQRGVNFNKAKSQRAAKWISSFVIFVTISTYIYDPIYRRLMEDEDEQHMWCISQYSSFVQIFDWSLNIFHFSTPFLINCISALMIIFTAARTRSSCQKTKSFKEHLYEQIQQHKHLLISPFILIILAIPRLIISFLSGCMESAQDSWFYLFGYFISFIPSIMTFVVFVLPSRIYMKEFKESMKRFWQR